MQLFWLNTPTLIHFQYQFHLPKHYLVQGKLKCWKYPTDPKIENWTSRDNRVNLHSLLIVADSDGLWSSMWNINADFESPSVKQSLQLIFSVNNQARINCVWAGFSSCFRIGRQYEELPGREDRASWLSYWRFYNRLEGQIHRRLLNRCVCGKKLVNGVKRTFMPSVWVERNLVVLSFKWSSHLSKEANESSFQLLTF